MIIDPNDPRLALIPDQPTKSKAAPIGQASAVKRYSIQRTPEQRSPDRRASIARRRRLATSGVMPPQLAAGYTVSQLACLKIVADEIQAYGVCALGHKQIAARAGTCETMAKQALWLAEHADTLITVQRRPRSGRKHLTNLIRIVRVEWLDWLAKGNRKAAAVKSCQKAKPVFADPRGVKKSPPRVAALDRRAVSTAGASREVEKEA